MLRRVLGLEAEVFPEMAAERFGAQEDMDRTWASFEPVASTLVDSFYLTVDHPGHDELVPRLEAVEPALRGIAYEGAGMGLMLLDALAPTRARLLEFVNGPGRAYRCLVYIGAGLVLPRLPRNPNGLIARHDPLLRWFMIDGYGFYEGFFCWRDTVERHRPPRRIAGYGRRAYDHGLGRSFWFSTGANVERITGTIRSFPANRQGDLWSGVGVACAYAAGVMDREAILGLLAAAGHHDREVAVGTAIASIFRAEAGHPAPHTDLACEAIWAADSDEVATVARRALARVPLDDAEAAYERWRTEISDRWVAPSAARHDLQRTAP